MRATILWMMRRLNIGAYDFRIKLGAVKRPHYGHCVYYSALLAKKLGYKKISIIEFGVAGGSGLVNLEYHARETSRLLSVDIEIYGFDSGKGLPPPTDFRDVPYFWKGGFYRIDEEKLHTRLKKSRLILGDVKETVKEFFEKQKPAPIAAVMFDLDYYSSTIDALKIFNASDEYFLPRIYCYFDDIIGTEQHLFCDYTGERLAIKEFNDISETKKFSPAYYLLGQPITEPWHHKIFIYHNFLHPRYNNFIADTNQQIPLE